MKKTPFIFTKRGNKIKTGSFLEPFLLKIALFIVVFFIQTVVSAQTAHKLLRQADKSYMNNDYKQAEENYTKAQRAQRSAKGDYNLANTIYQQQRYDEAAKQYEDIAAKTQDKKLKFNSLYNKGNAHFAKQAYDKALDAYKGALRLNPNDTDAKKNLALAQRMIQQQQQQKDKENKDKNKQNNDKNKQDPQNKNQENKDKQDPNQQKNQQQQPQDAQQNAQQNQNQAAQQEMKKDQARQILEIMDDEERKVQQRMRKGKPKPSRSTKDW